MKRKLPVLIAIILALAISLAACQSQNPPVTGNNQNVPNPVQQVDPQLNDSAADPTLGTAPAPVDPAPADPTPAEPKYITMDEAIAIALKDAGFKEADVKGLHAELERDDGITIYDVDFYKDAKEYDYEINAESGKILKPVKKTENTTSSASKPASSGSSSTASKNITKDEAINKALSHAGLKKSQVSRLKAELDKDDGVTLYEVDFETAEWEFEYEINANTGKIRKAEKDRND